MAKRLANFVETFRGSSFPTRCVTTDGEELVIKLRGSGNGSEALISEYIVNRLASQSGLPVPDVCVIEIAGDYPWNYGTDEFYDLVQKSGGANLGISLLDGAEQLSQADLGNLPIDLVSQVVTLDLAFVNFDRPLASGNLVHDSTGAPWIIDHGSCRFLFQSLESRKNSLALPANHLFVDQVDTFEPDWLYSMQADTLVSATVAELPEQWLLDVQLTRQQVLQLVLDRLNNLDLLARGGK